jgi:SAM-dependent methyltransferase
LTDNSSTQVETYWEKVAKSKWGSYITEVERRVLLKANNLVVKRKTAYALEIGCEGGRWSKLLADLGWNMICTDINPHLISECQARIPTAKCILVHANDQTLLCKTNSLQLILCIEVIPVLRSDWFMIEASRVLQPEGLIVGVFENKLSFRGYVHHLVSVVTGRFDYYKVAYPNWRKKFRKQGFNMIHEEGICWFPFSRNSNSPFIPFLTHVEGNLGLRRLPSVSPWIVFLARKEPSVNISEQPGQNTLFIRYF